MTTSRLNPDRGWCNPEALPKGPNGRARCRECGAEVPAGRKSFCSTGCVDSWKIRSDPTHVRIRLFERDHGVCAICGVDCTEQVKRLERLDPEFQKRWDRSCWGRRSYEESIEKNAALKKELQGSGISVHRYLHRHRYGIWDADHIVPVVEGGGEARALDSFRTLCCRCHGQETAKLRKRRASKKNDFSS